MLWGDGFEIESLIHCRFAAAGLRITEVPSVERERDLRHQQPRAVSDGWRVLQHAARRAAPAPHGRALDAVSSLRRAPAEGSALASESVTTLRIGMIATRCQPEIGGIESHVAEVAGRIAARGYDLEVLTTDRSGDLPKVERVDGYVVRRFRAYPASRDWYFSPGLFLAALRARYDVVHVQGIHTLVPPLAMIAAILRRTPFVLTFHTGGNSSAFRERARGTQFRLLSPLLRRARRLIGVSVFEARRFEEIVGLPEGAITVIRNGGSLPALRVAVTPEPARVVSVGRIERYKGHHKAIEALPHLLKTHPDATGRDPRSRAVRARAPGARRPSSAWPTGSRSGSSRRWTGR